MVNKTLAPFGAPCLFLGRTPGLGTFPWFEYGPNHWSLLGSVPASWLLEPLWVSASFYPSLATLGLRGFPLFMSRLRPQATLALSESCCQGLTWA